MDHWNEVPDMTTFAKGASSGYYPIGGVIISDKIFQTLKSGKKGIFARRDRRAFCGRSRFSHVAGDLVQAHGRQATVPHGAVAPSF